MEPDAGHANLTWREVGASRAPTRIFPMALPNGGALAMLAFKKNLDALA